MGIVCGSLDVHTSRCRYNGYVAALKNHDLTPDPRHVLHCASAQSYEQVKAMFTDLPREQWPTAIFAANNTRAASVLRAFMELGIDVPAQISVVSYGHISLPWLFSLKLTHLAQDMVRIGRKCVEMALRMLESPRSGFKAYSVNSSLLPVN